MYSSGCQPHSRSDCLPLQTFLITFTPPRLALIAHEGLLNLIMSSNPSHISPLLRTCLTTCASSPAPPLRPTSSCGS